MEQDKQIPSKPDQDLPPFVKTWKQFYRLLIGWLIFLIIAFYIFTVYFQ
ncbi:hypothetical protein [Pedobacter metabolipauper]|uniref:Uncharacterized protein n=1 Tax=Pedobacter metabolipauper TaxID=425513 RepID=A0A4R6SRY1_9SPHI|nr:hypothetical protein [Pedobacter metabolipauper]TDQ06984.1 hypothetical protein ATK78_4000 [Pedobacter metabolipauper]